MILAEQKVDFALAFAEDALVLERGRIAFRAGQPSCGRTKRCNTGCWRSASCDRRRLAQNRIGRFRRTLSPHGGAAMDYSPPELTFRLV